MLLTTCPNCQAQFKVTPEQLNVRSGRVMCGRCRHVFNSFESLQRIDSTLGDPPALTPLQAPAPRTSLLDHPPAEDFATDPPASTRFDTTDEAPAFEPSAEVAPPAHESIQVFRAPVSGLVDSIKGPASAPWTPPTPPPPPTFTPMESAPPAEMLAPAEDPLPAASPFELPPQEDMRGGPAAPGASAPYRNAPLLPKEPRPGMSPGWTFLAVVSVLALAGQLAYVWRSDIVSHYPALRPALDKACETLGCNLPWGRDATLIKVENSNLIEELGARGRYLLTATFTNRATVIQDYPHFELSLTDTNNQTLTRRILTPEIYLGRKPARGEGVAPDAAIPVNIRLESQLPGTAGYDLKTIYP